MMEKGRIVEIIVTALLRTCIIGLGLFGMGLIIGTILYYAGG